MNRPKLFKLEFYAGPPADPFATEWPEIPREVFRSEAEARTAALFWVKSFDDGDGSCGAYSIGNDWWWARQQIGDNHFRKTRIVVVEA